MNATTPRYRYRGDWVPMKARGYRWPDGSSGRPKYWWFEVGEEARNDDLHYLRTEVCRYSDADPLIKRLTALDRFRG